MSEDAAEIKRMSPAEFRELGYLQEVNRRFLHPLGLALEVSINKEDGTVTFGEVWDYRDDPDGMRFADGMIDGEKAKRIERERSKLAVTRYDILGYEIQPATGLTPDDD